ncbi:Rbm44 [Acrasis kona]|uniref:Rbm44 n=1 Tax=Acrasis kona TaxID=1008807 RepID=A0AAW2YKJ6_9EUKA
MNMFRPGKMRIEDKKVEWGSMSLWKKTMSVASKSLDNTKSLLWLFVPFALFEGLTYQHPETQMMPQDEMTPALILTKLLYSTPGPYIVDTLCKMITGKSVLPQ